MKNLISKNNFALLATAIALLTAPALSAQTLTFGVDLNTATLNAQNSANAPFFLDFQLNYGSNTLPTSTVTLSNFQFTNGSASGSATTTGTVTGNLTASDIILTASSTSLMNELYQPFSSGTTDIKFSVSVTGFGVGVTPTSFTSAIMDSSLGFPAQIFTTAPDTESMVVLNLGAAPSIGNVGAFSSLSSADTNTSVTGVSASITPVPEPSTTAAIVGCAVAMVAFIARRFRKPQVA